MPLEIFISLIFLLLGGTFIWQLRRKKNQPSLDFLESLRKHKGIIVFKERLFQYVFKHNGMFHYVFVSKDHKMTGFCVGTESKQIHSFSSKTANEILRLLAENAKVEV